MMKELIGVQGGREVRAYVPAIPDGWPAGLKSGLTIWRLAALEQRCGECGGRFVQQPTGIERFTAGWVEHTKSCSGNSDTLESIADAQGLDISEMFSVSMGG